jgi:putative nucleotidyltransferase with HDIG domain
MSLLTLAQVRQSMHDLPSLPAVVMELLSSIDQEDADISVLARKVSLDQALTAKTLRLANSPSFGLQVRVTTIQQAITFLGFQTTRHLITTAALSGSFADNRCAGFDNRGFWRHSIATAACARVLARRMRLNQDFAFTAGLLHDIGRLVLVTGFPEHYSQVLTCSRREDRPLLDVEREQMGVDHVAAGAALAEHWQFSDTMRHAIAYHHEPEAPGAGLLAPIVHVANAIVHALDLAGDENELVPPVSMVAWTALGLSQEALLHVFRETEMQFEEMSNILAA